MNDSEILCPEHPQYTSGWYACVCNQWFIRCLPTEPAEKRWALWTEIILLGTIWLLGLVGNSLSIYILKSDKKASSTNSILQALAIWDILSLTLAMVNNFLRLFINHGQEFATYERYAPTAAMALINGLLHLQNAARYGSVAMTMLVTVDRYMAVCKPLVIRRRGHTLIAILALSGYVVVFYIPNNYEYEILQLHGVYKNLNYSINVINVTTIKLGPLSENNAFQIVYKIALEALLRDLGPIVIMIIFNIFLYRALRDMRRRYLNMRRASRAKDNKQHISSSESLTKTINIIVVTFICFTMPNLVIKLLDTVRQIALINDIHSNIMPFLATDTHARSIGNLFQSVASAVNFVIYVICAKKFKRIFLMKFCRSKCMRSVVEDALRSNSSECAQQEKSARVCPIGVMPISLNTTTTNVSIAGDDGDEGTQL